MSMSLQTLKATSIYSPRALPGVGAGAPAAPFLYPAQPRPMLSMRPTTMRSPYMGDPGLFGFLGSVAKGVVGAATGLVTGGPIGAVTGALTGSGIIKAPAAPMPSSAPLINPMILTSGIAAPVQQAPVTPVPGIGGAIQRLLPGGKTGYEVAIPAGGAAPSGYHLNKSDYFLRDGTFVPKGSRWVKNRRRNPLNPRALDRAMGRLTSAKRASKKIGRISIRKASSCR